MLIALEKNTFEADHSELLLSVTYPGNVWHVLRDSSNPEYFTEIYRVEGDTLIGDTLWQIISYSKDSNAFENGQWPTKFYLYENEKKLFCALPNDLSPKQYFDFDAEVDDQLELFVPYTQSFINVVVQDKQTILLGGLEWKLITILKNYAGETWIEGIGSLKGIFYGNIDPELVGVQFALRCFSQDHIVVYPVGFSENCYFSNVSVSGSENYNHILVYPNPFDDYINTLIAPACQSNSINIELFDINGRIIYKQETVRTLEPVAIPTKEFLRGIYVIKVTTGKTQFYSKIFKL